MKIYISHSNSFDFDRELYQPMKNSVLAQNHDIFLPHEGGKHQNTRENIRESDLLVAEVSYPSTGSGIEMGMATAFGLPVWCVYRDGSKPSGSVKYISERIFEYKNSEELIKFLDTNI